MTGERMGTGVMEGVFGGGVEGGRGEGGYSGLGWGGCGWGVEGGVGGLCWRWWKVRGVAEARGEEIE